MIKYKEYKMNYKTHNELENIKTSGTHLQGYVQTDYNRLVELFGTPSEYGDGHKTDAEWEVRFEDGTVATIYNYKTGKNYLGSDGLEVTEIDEWNVGGFNENSVNYIKGVL